MNFTVLEMSNIAILQGMGKKRTHLNNREITDYLKIRQTEMYINAMIYILSASHGGVGRSEQFETTCVLELNKYTVGHELSVSLLEKKVFKEKGKAKMKPVCSIGI